MADLSKRWRSASPLCTSKRTRAESPVSPTRVPVEFTSFLPLKGTTTTTQGKRRFLFSFICDFKRLIKAVFPLFFFHPFSNFRIRTEYFDSVHFFLNFKQNERFGLAYAVRIGPEISCLKFNKK